MRIQLIQQKAPIGSQITVTLETGAKISGSLVEIGLDYITLSKTDGQTTILVDAILMFAVQSEKNQVKVSDATDIDTESTDSPPEQIKPSDPTDIDTESTDSPPEQIEPSDPTDIDTESTDSPPEQIEPSDPTDINTKLISFADSEERASEKLIEIENQFNVQIQAAEIELKSLDFTFPAEELIGWQNTDVAGVWLQIKNKYDYAEKSGELNAKFGRLQQIVHELKSLTERFPNSSAFKRTLAYFYSISNDWEEALHNYQRAAIQSKNANDWFDVAVCALELDKEELACYSLQKFFYGGLIIHEPKAWYTYVKLLEKFNNHLALRELCETDKYDTTEEEIKVLLKTAIYLLKKTGAEALATEIIRKQLTGSSAKSLLGEACQKLDDQPDESYHRFLEVMNVISALDGEDLYREAEQADNIEKNFEKAEHLYQECIKRDIRHDTAIKNLAMVFTRSERPEEAVHLLEKNRSRVKDKKSLDNRLINVYQHAGQYDKVINLLNNSFKQARTGEKRSQIRRQIANAYIKLEDYVSAESQFRQVLQQLPDNITVQRNLALCLAKQDRYHEAEQILNQIQSTSPDVKTAELLEAVERAKTTGEFILDDDRIIEIETALSYFSGELSKFAQFFLARCTFEGIPTGRISDEKYIGSEKDVRHDIGTLEDIAKQLGTESPRDRSNYYLSAARIYGDVGDNRNFFHRYLCRSFTSRGDDAVIENRNLDTVQEWYCEALTVYDGDRSLHRDEQEAVNALVRYLYSTWGHGHIHLTPNTPTIDKVVSDVISNHPDREKAFDAIAYLVLHSRYAADKVLNRLYYNEVLRMMVLDYLKGMGVDIPDTIEGFDDFVLPWNDLRNEKFNRSRAISNKLRLLDSFELTTAWLEDIIRLAEDIRSDLFFKLDQQRVGELQRILETALELCKQVTFEERERLCIQLRTYCQDLLGEIVESPTRLSVEDVYPIIEVIRQTVNAYLEELYMTSKPQLTLRLPVESYVPGTDRQIEVQIVLENERGRSPAESLELVIQQDEAFFRVTEPNIKQNESLRGGEQSILTVPMRVTPDALQSQTFSLSVCAEYRTRTEELVQTPAQNLSIRLYSEEEFEKIENPYAAYAEGGIVGDKSMFFGREQLIHNIAQSIRESRRQSKCVLVFGQYRSGKSSVLYHLKSLLQEDKNLLILNLGNISPTLDTNSSNPILYQILKRILTELEGEIDTRVDEGFTPLNLSFPDEIQFYNHPAPLQLFENIFKSFKRQVPKQEDWYSEQVVLLIDEFQYIYDLIVADKLPETFMQIWKALLQANYFNAVLVGQDVMPKFKDRFANEFGTTQDERVTYLNELDAIKLIEDPIRISGRHSESRYREQAIERILDLTAGSPFYIQIICNRLVEYMNAKRARLVTEADVEQVKDGLIKGENALAKEKFHSFTTSGDTSDDAISDDDARKVLKTIADNSVTGSCPRDRIICETRLPVDAILDDLVKREVIACDQGQHYDIRVGLFKEWLAVNG